MKNNGLEELIILIAENTKFKGAKNDVIEVNQCSLHYVNKDDITAISNKFDIKLRCEKEETIYQTSDLEVYLYSFEQMILMENIINQDNFGKSNLIEIFFIFHKILDIIWNI